MALTDFCSIFASVHENAINTVIKAVATQRPSLFNYGTPFFVQHPNLLCEKIVVHPKLPPSTRVGAQPLLPVPGMIFSFGLEFCMQVTKLAIDFHKGDIKLPPELGTLQPQRFALAGRVCAAIACPPRGWFLPRSATRSPARYARSTRFGAARQGARQPGGVPAAKPHAEADVPGSGRP